MQPHRSNALDGAAATLTVTLDSDAVWQCHCPGLGLVSLRAARERLHSRAAILSSVPRMSVSECLSVPFVRAELLYTVIRVRPSCQNIPIQRQDHAPWNHHPSSFLRLQYIYQHQSKKKHTSTTGRRAGLCGFIVYTGYTLRCTT